MTAYEPQVGHRVRMTRVVEGVVTRTSVTGMVSIDEYAWIVDADRQAVTFERLPDLEPTWAPGDLVIDARGDIFRRRVTDDRYPFPWVLAFGAPGSGGMIPNDYLVRPLRRLVPEDPA